MSQDERLAPDPSANPFEAYELDPLEGAAAITERLRERIEDASTEEEREAIRVAWRALTLDPRERLRLALFAHPETRVLPTRPARPSTPAPPPLTAADLLPHPDLAAAFGAPVDGSAGSLAIPLDLDPILARKRDGS